MTTVSALISQPDYFTVEPVSVDMDSLQKIVGGYIEAVQPIHGEAFAYVNEEGRLQGLERNVFSTFYLDRLTTKRGYRFSDYDYVVGPAVWLGDSGNGVEKETPLETIHDFTHAAVALVWKPDCPITVIKHGNDIWVYDTPDGPALQIQACVRTARSSEEHGKIECFTGITPGTWQETRVDIMDDHRIDLHDERADRSYG